MLKEHSSCIRINGSLTSSWKAADLDNRRNPQRMELWNPFSPLCPPPLVPPGLCSGDSGAPPLASLGPAHNSGGTGACKPARLHQPPGPGHQASSRLAVPCALFEPYQEFLLSPGIPSNLESENLSLKFRRNLIVPPFCSISARDYPLCLGTYRPAPRDRALYFQVTTGQKVLLWV